jgi:hypothetical protein
MEESEESLRLWYSQSPRNQPLKTTLSRPVCFFQQPIKAKMAGLCRPAILYRYGPV